MRTLFSGTVVCLHSNQIALCAHMAAMTGDDEQFSENEGLPFGSVCNKIVALTVSIYFSSVSFFICHELSRCSDRGRALTDDKLEKRKRIKTNVETKKKKKIV